MLFFKTLAAVVEFYLLHKLFKIKTVLKTGRKVCTKLKTEAR